MIERHNCPVCGSEVSLLFLERYSVPVHQNLVMTDQDAALGVVRSDLKLAVCEHCGFVFNRAFDLSKLDYGAKYDNAQTYSQSFSDYVDCLARQLVFEKNVRNCRIVEVGCGQGLFLRRLVEMEESGNVGFGFDPAYMGPEEVLDGRLRFEKCYYGPDKSEISADVVVCRHVIEHVPEPLELLSSIRQALCGSSDARVMFETPCVEWILRNRVVWDFFYEHCSYFSAISIQTALEKTGFKLESVNYVFGGQYMWVEASLSDQPHLHTHETPNVMQQAIEFAQSEARQREALCKSISKYSACGKIALWGAGAKGVTFANMIDSDRTLIDCIVDMNPNKQNCFIAGTGHPIVSHRELAGRGVINVMVMNPNYSAEIKQLLREEQLNIPVIDLMEWGKT